MSQGDGPAVQQLWRMRSRNWKVAKSRSLPCRALVHLLMDVSNCGRSNHAYDLTMNLHGTFDASISAGSAYAQLMPALQVSLMLQYDTSLAGSVYPDHYILPITIANMSFYNVYMYPHYVFYYYIF